jgi:hypothetical protein
LSSSNAMAHYMMLGHIRPAAEGCVPGVMGGVAGCAERPPGRCIGRALLEVGQARVLVSMTKR